MAPLDDALDHLQRRHQVEYYVSFALAGLAAFLLMAPTPYHRVLFRRGGKEYLVRVANRLTIAGLSAVGISMTGATMFVTDVIFGLVPAVLAGVVASGTGIWLWGRLPLVARRREIVPAPAPGASCAIGRGATPVAYRASSRGAPATAAAVGGVAATLLRLVLAPV